MVDMKKYATGLLRPEDLQSGTRNEKIIAVYISEKLNAPILEFDSGESMVAWNNIARVLGHAYGYEDTDWIGHTIELSLGSYTNKDGEEKGTIVVKPMTSRDSKEIVPIKKELDDEIPF
jgi:hypothetical protein